MFLVNASAGVPVYLQILHQVLHAIETGVLQPGDGLPGVRRLAQELVVSPNTVVKAYEQLERDGWIENRPGSGAYVSPRPRMRSRIDRLRKAKDRVHAVAERLRADGLTEEELHRVFDAELIVGAPNATRIKP